MVKPVFTLCFYSSKLNTFAHLRLTPFVLYNLLGGQSVKF